MKSVLLLRKNVVAKNGLQLSELNFSGPVLSITNMCIRTAFTKPQTYSKLEEDRADSIKSQNTSNNGIESDVFGKLKYPIEKYKYRPHSSIKYRHNSGVATQNRKIIKVKPPIADESDVFGNLSEKKPMWYPDMLEEPKVDNDQSDDSVMVKNISRRYRCPKKYMQEMKRLVNAKKIKDALDLFVDMKRNFVTPIHSHYAFMIGTCGRVGYTEMAFKLLRQMTDRSFQPTAAVLTGLFNSCAESPFPEYGLKKARSLKEKIEKRNWQINQMTYHAMIKAFGKCGDLLTAFEIVDEMAKADIKIDVETYSFLLMSCISNKEAGFTYAIEVWRKMKAKKCIPNVFTCNLLLRAARDCDIGTDEISCLLLQHWSNYSKRPYGFITKENLSKEPILRLKSSQESITSNIEHSENAADENVEDTMITDNIKRGSPFHETEASKFDLDKILNTNVVKRWEDSVTSVLTTRPVNGTEIVELVNIKTPTDRLSLIGGLEGFLEFMYNAKIKPNIKTLTLLLESLPPNIESEEKLLTALDKYHIKPDIDFFNMLIKKRNLRKETEAGRTVLALINKYELTPDIVTFGVLALGCRTFKQATIFMDGMKKFGASPNIEIAGALLRNACFIFNFHYMKFVLELMEEQEIKPNEKVLLLLEETLRTVRKNVIAMEQGKEVNEIFHQKNLSTNFTKFCNFYEDWLKRMKMETEKHPWTQYKTDIIDRVKIE